MCMYCVCASRFVCVCVRVCVCKCVHVCLGRVCVWKCVSVRARAIGEDPMVALSQATCIACSIWTTFACAPQLETRLLQLAPIEVLLPSPRLAVAGSGPVARETADALRYGGHIAPPAHRETALAHVDGEIAEVGAHKCTRRHTCALTYACPRSRTANASTGPHIRCREHTHTPITPLHTQCVNT